MSNPTATAPATTRYAKMTDAERATDAAATFGLQTIKLLELLSRTGFDFVARQGRGSATVQNVRFRRYIKLDGQPLHRIPTTRKER